MSHVGVLFDESSLSAGAPRARTLGSLLFSLDLLAFAPRFTYQEAKRCRSVSRSHEKSERAKTTIPRPPKAGKIFSDGTVSGCFVSTEMTV